MSVIARVVHFLCAWCGAAGGFAQYEIPAKEQFDKLNHKVVYNGSYNGIVNYMLSTNSWSGYEYGEQIGPTLESYVRMYETTKDKAYVVKFVNLALKAVGWRKANFRFNDLLYMDGQLLWPMAHFIHLVLIDDPDLGLFEVAVGVDLIDVPTSTIPVNELPAQASYTMQEIALWLLARSVESLDAIIDDHWDPDIGFEGATAVNLQGGFAGALLHLGHMAAASDSYSGLQSYLDRGARLAALLRSHVEIEDDCSCSNYSQPVLRSTTHNAYWWYHAGWEIDKRDCIFAWEACPPYTHFNQANLPKYQEFIEDISHAIPTLIIPFVSHRYTIYTNNSYPFSDAEMVRFRNTFTHHVWDATAGGFHNAVNGQDAPVYPSSYDGQFNVLRYNALAWMPLQQFDQTSGAAVGDPLYDIVMDFYVSEVYDSPTDLTGGFHYLGLAEVVAAQWEKECFDLTLFNRNLVYDQEFTAKALLTVDPAGEAGASFADPVIHEPRFTVVDQVQATFRAGSAVIFEPGFEAVLGSVVEAVIDPLGCELAYKSLAPPVAQRTEVDAMEEGLSPNEAVVESMAADGSLPPQPVDRLRMVPNPTTGRAFAFLQLQEHRTVTMTVHDATGRKVWSGQFGSLSSGEHHLPLGVLLPAGVYHCTVLLDNIPLSERLVVE